MSIDGYLKEGVSVDSQPCFGSLVTISTIDGDIGMIEREFSLLVEKAVNNHDRLQQENAALKEANAWHVNRTKELHEDNAELRESESDLVNEIEDLRGALSVLSDADNHSVSQVRTAMRKARLLMNK